MKNRVIYTKKAHELTDAIEVPKYNDHLRHRSYERSPFAYESKEKDLRKYKRKQPENISG